MSDVQLNLVTSIEDALEVKRWLGERRPVLGVDTETSGLRWYRDDLRLVQVGDGERAYAIPFDDWRGLCKELLNSYDRPVAIHNSKFDRAFLERNGIRIAPELVHDTQVLTHLDDTSGAKALKLAVTRRIDPGYDAGQRLLDDAMRTEGWTWATIPLDFQPYWAYAALDASMCAQLYERLQHHTALPVYEVEMRAHDVLLRMEQRGMRVDLEYAATAAARCRAYAQDIRTWAKEAHGFENFTSDDQFARWLQQQGWEPKVFTATGKPSVAKAVLLHVIANRPDLAPICRARIDCKHMEKMASAYFDNFLENAVGDRIHANINPIGARTGRMSISDPALQTLTRDDPLVRDAFIASPGRTLLLCDYDQIEMRLMVHFARAESMAEVFNTGRDDIFTWMARMIYQDPSIVKTDLRRQITKNAAYSKIYCAGVETFSNTAGIPVEEGGAFMRQFDSMFPEVNGFLQEVIGVARQRREEEGQAYVTSPLGRTHKLPERGKEAEDVYKLVNYLIQGTAADIFKERLVELDAAGVGEFLVLPIHDELDFDVPLEIIDEVEATVLDVMADDRWSVKLSVGAERVQRWGDKYR